MSNEKSLATKPTPIEKAAGLKKNSIDKSHLRYLTKCILSEVLIISNEELLQFNKQTPLGHIIHCDLGIFYYNQNAIIYRDNAIALIRNDPLYYDVSGKTITNAYTDLIHNAKINTELSDQELAEFVHSFLGKLRSSIKEWKFIMPIEHLELSDLTEVKIGSVRIVPFNTLMAENERIKKLNEYICKEYADKICGELFVKGESDEAISKGKIGLEQVINLLRAYIPIIYKRDNDIKIGLTKYD